MKARAFALTALLGVAFGVVLSRVGFSSWDEIHQMFTFSDLRLMLVFGITIAILAVAWAVFARVWGHRWPAKLVHEGTLLGGVLFGAGWALSGACPSIALIQLGEGQLAAVWTLVGVVAGNWAYGVARERWLKSPAQSCSED